MSDDPDAEGLAHDVRFRRGTLEQEAGQREIKPDAEVMVSLIHEGDQGHGVATLP